MKRLLIRNAFILSCITFNQLAWFIHTKRIVDESNLQNEKLYDTIVYLFDVVNKNDIPLTEFDAIAIQEILNERNNK